jgi:O-antigen ligase
MQKIFVLGSLASCLFLAAQFLPYLSETLGLSGGASESSEYRRRLFARGLEEFAARPLQGYSMPELAQRLHDMVQGEGIIDFVNAYIWIMLIAGIFGLTLFIGVFLFFVRGVYRVGRFKRRGNSNAEAGVFVFATLLMLMEMLFFTSFGTRPAYFVFALFGFAAAYIRVQSATTHIAPVEEPLLAVGVQRPVRVSGPS